MAKTYDTYKDSGIAWIGEIPGEWRVDILSLHLYDHCLYNDNLKENNLLSLSYGRIIRKDINTKEGLLPSSFNRYNIIDKGDIVLRLTDLQNDKKSLRTGLCKERGIITSAYLTLRNRGYDDSSFLHYLLHTYDLCKVFYGMGNGVRQGMNYSDVRKIKIPCPPLSVQQSISSFLDTKCGEIDSLISIQEEMISELLAYKQSVITEAVTKGLDKKAKMKNSGVEWIGDIPEHWIPTYPKIMFKQRNERAKQGERQLASSQKYGIVYQDEYMKQEGVNLVTVGKNFDILKHVEPNDFVISMRSFQGGLEYSDKAGCISSAYVMLIPNEELVYPPFFRWFFKSVKYINALQSTSNFVRDGQAMRYSHFIKVTLFQIPLLEQRTIASYLDEKIPQIDSLIALKQSKIESLKEYKKSIIYEYVTGKKRV